MEKIKLNTSTTIQFSDSDDVVFFLVNIQEMFNVSSNYNGMKSIIRSVFEISKRFVPFKTGLMRSSYTLEYINADVVRLFFDPAKILGKTRLGRTVRTYYPKYLIMKPKTANWLDYVMKQFLDSLIIGVVALKRRRDLKEAQEQLDKSKRQIWKEEQESLKKRKEEVHIVNINLLKDKEIDKLLVEERAELDLQTPTEKKSGDPLSLIAALLLIKRFNDQYKEKLKKYKEERENKTGSVK